jgi:hypothetical protein
MANYIKPIDVNIPKDTPGSSALMGMGENLWNTAQPVNTALGGIFNDFLSGGFNVTNTPQWSAALNVANSQYDQAANQIKGNMPAGGQLLNALADSSNQRAGTLTNFAGDLANQLFGQATGWTDKAGQNAALAYGGAGDIQSKLYSAIAQKAAADAQMLAGQRNTDAGGEFSMAEAELMEQGAWDRLLESLATQEWVAGTQANAGMANSSNYNAANQYMQDQQTMAGLGTGLGGLLADIFAR